MASNRFTARVGNDIVDFVEELKGDTGASNKDVLNLLISVYQSAESCGGAITWELIVRTELMRDPDLNDYALRRAIVARTGKNPNNKKLPLITNKIRLEYGINK